MDYINEISEAVQNIRGIMKFTLFFFKRQVNPFIKGKDLRKPVSTDKFLGIILLVGN